ncbi:MAG: spermidine/putrescine ABC transporter substrate-binding protein, partial [Nitrospiraceae bacterium]|nr:spermidine/putrescine ABC transporter substrate-binding protein [Nitrospiraceae bacterium]
AAGLLLGVPGLLAACGGGGATSTTAGAGSPTTQKLSDTLNFYNWSDYIAEDTIPNFQKEFGVKVVYDNYSSNDQLLAKLQSGATGYDIIVPSDYMITTMLGLNLLQEVDLANVPNIANLYARFREEPFDPGNKYSVPWQWGTTGIGYNSEEVPDFKPSWDMLWDSKYKGKITMLTEIRDIFAVALFKLGYDANTVDPKQIDEAKQLLIEQKPLLKHYTSDTYIDELASNDPWLAHGYSGDVFQAQAENDVVQYGIPAEGAITWVDSMCIPKDAPHKYTAEVFMNYILQPEVSAAISNLVVYASPNEKAEEFINPDILGDPAVYPTKEVLDKLTFLQELGADTELYNSAFEEVKAA